MSLKDQFEILASRTAKMTPEEITELVKKAHFDTQKGRSELGRAMSSFITDNLAKRRFMPVQQVPMVRCPNCSCEYYDDHPDNGCGLGIVQNVNES